MGANLITILPLVKDLMQDFCYQYEYTMPSTEYIKEHKIILVKEIESSEVNSKVNGNYKHGEKTITLSYNRHENDIAYTLAHEIGHLIQSYNLGAAWSHVYSHQLKLVGYTDNMFEIQARYMTTLMKLFCEEYIAAIIEAIAKFIKEHKDKLKLKSKFINNSWTGFKHYYKDELEDLITRKNNKYYKHLHSTRYKGRR